MKKKSTRRPAFLKEPFWKEYVEHYVNDPFYWYQPKGFAITQDNVGIIKKRLSVLRKYEGESWSRQQKSYTRELVKNELISLRKKPRQYTSSDYGALVRMNKMIFTTLGLAWVDKDSSIFITPVGRSFLKSRTPSRIVENQLLKYQIPNPSMQAQAEDVQLFPHLFLLEMLLRYPEQGISRQEYILFVSRAKSINELHWASEGIEKYRRLSKELRSELCDYLDHVPILKDGRILTDSRGKSMYNRIKLNSSYALDFLSFPSYIESAGDQLRIPQKSWSLAQDIARSHGRSSYFIDFSNQKDWFSYYGDDKRTGSVKDALEYYEKTSNVVQAGQAFVEARNRGLIKDKVDFKNYVSLRIRERMLEDFLEYNLHRLEDGMELVKRQHPTLVGPIDLLARDKKKRYVVIELKKGRASDKVVGQLQRYRGYIKNELSKSGKDVRGMVVAREIDNKLKYAFRGADSPGLLQLFKFDFLADINEVHYMTR